MKDSMKESVSALLDGEASELELRRLLRDADHDELRDVWSGYQRASQVLTESGREDHWQLDISASVSAAIAEGEPSMVKRIFRPAASMAVAASVFAAVLVTGQLLGLAESGTEPGVRQSASASVGLVNAWSGNGVNASYPVSRSQAPQADTQARYNRMARERLQQYIIPHTDQAALNTPQGLMPFARVSAQKSLED